MEFNSTTIVLIFFLLLTLYLLDNIKELEDSIVKNTDILNNNTRKSKKYFQDIVKRKQQLKKDDKKDSKKDPKKDPKKDDDKSLKNYTVPKETPIKIPSVNIDRNISESSTEIKNTNSNESKVKVNF